VKLSNVNDTINAFRSIQISLVNRTVTSDLFQHCSHRFRYIWRWNKTISLAVGWNETSFWYQFYFSCVESKTTV